MDRLNFSQQALLRPALFLLALFSACEDATAQRAGENTQNLPAPVLSLVSNYCLDCHSADDPAGDFDLQSMSLSDSVFMKEDFDPVGWDRVLGRLTSRQMPPLDAERPGEEEYGEASAAIAAALDRRAEAFPTPGRTNSIRRMTRVEYQNAIRDLLLTQIDAAELLPADESSHGFDNITVGELSPMLLSRYLSAAQKISRLAVGGSGHGPAGVTFRVPADRTQESHVEGLPLGTRGGARFLHTFPQDGAYEIELRLTRDRDEKVEGLNEQHDIDVLIDRQRVHRFSVAPPPDRLDYTHADTHLNNRFRMTAGPHQVVVTFPQKFASLLESKRQPFDARYNRHRHPRITPALFQVSIVGPFDAEGPGDTPSRRQIFVCDVAAGADPRNCAEQILSSLLRRAYRRPITQDDLESPLWFYDEGLREGDHEAGIESALTSILVNPNFLFRLEQDPEGVASGTPYRISDVELASRLSFFLWSSIPDERLLELAEKGTLSDPGILARQVDRMLHDNRSKSLVSNFGSQWLYLRNLDSITPDLRLFPDFDDNLRQAFRRETELALSDVIRNDHSVLRLLQSDYTFLNDRLAKHYGIAKVFGSQFRRVNLNQIDSEAARRRGGLLRHGSILTVTSYATRTSPTIRGHWILKNILGTPPPPPPPNVPNLKEKTALAATSVRERLAQHRIDPACASCHDLMDPIGFALENFDALGRWREFDETIKIDSRGTLPDGTEIDGAESLEAGILARPEMFVTALTERLMTFALGRGIEHTDGPAIRSIVRNARSNGYPFSSLVHGIVASKPFLMRTAE